MPGERPQNLRQAIRDEGLRHTIDFLWQKAEPFHERQTRPGASGSGLQHCLAVESNVFRILSGVGELERFHDGEVFLLSAAACCHDFDKGLPDQAKGELASELGFGPDPADLRHGWGSGRFIVRAHDALGLTEEQAELVDLIVRYHNEMGDALRAALEDLHNRTCSFRGELDVPALVTLLKLGDALECHGRLRAVDVAAALTCASEAPGDADAQRQAQIAVFRERAREWFIAGEVCVLPVAPRSLSELADCRACFEWLHENEFRPIVGELQRLGLPWKLRLEVNDDYLDVPAPRTSASALPGLYSYGPEDADILCGRHDDIRAVCGLVEHYRFSAVIGPSGVGKSSLIAAGVIPMFENLGRPWVLTRPDPAAGVLFRPSDFCEALGRPVGDEDFVSLCAELQEKASGKLSLVVIDQFEDIAYYGFFAPDSVFSVINEARFCAPDVHFLFSYRDDAHARLLPVCELLAGSSAGLPARGVRTLGLADARRALAALLTRADVQVSADLLDMVADQFREASQGEGGHDSVYPPFIQMMAALVIDLAEDGLVTPERYSEAVSESRDADPGASMVDRYLDSVLEDLNNRHGLDQESEANPILISLSRTTGERAQVAIGEIASLASVEPGRVAEVLPWLREARLVRQLADGRWEIAHDFLARCIAESRMSPEQHRARAVVETLRHRARNYEYVQELLTQSELRELFFQRPALRDQLTDGERDFILRSAWERQGPAWWAIADEDKRALFLRSVRAATDMHARVRGMSAQSIGAIGHPDGLDILMRLATDAHADVQSAAIQAIGCLGDPRGVDVLLRLLEDDWAPDYAILLGRIADVRPLIDQVGILRPLLGKFLALTVAEAIRDIAAALSPESLRDLAKNSNAAIRWAIAGAIDAVKHPALLRALEELLADTDAAVRCAAVGQVGRTCGPEGDTLLAPLMSDDSHHVRRAVAEALGALGQSGSHSLLKQLVIDPEDSVQTSAVRSIGLLRHPAALDDLMELARNGFSEIRAAAAEAIGVRGDPAGYEMLSELSRDVNSDVRRAAAAAIAALGDYDVVSSLLALGSDKSPDVRRAAAEAIGQLGALDGAETLVALAGDEDRKVRVAAAKGIGALGVPGGVAALRTLSADDDGDVRAAAAESLGALGEAADLDVLRTLSADEDDSVRSAAAYAIRSILQREGLEAVRRFLDLHERGVGIETLVQLDWLLYCPQPLREAFDPGREMHSPF